MSRFYFAWMTNWPRSRPAKEPRVGPYEALPFFSSRGDVLVVGRRAAQACAVFLYFGEKEKGESWPKIPQFIWLT
jgi:predicted small integral membrane protein